MPHLLVGFDDSRAGVWADVDGRGRATRLAWEGACAVTIRRTGSRQTVTWSKTRASLSGSWTPESPIPLDEIEVEAAGPLPSGR